jgi:outer membrane protein insertion porin family
MARTLGVFIALAMSATSALPQSGDVVCVPDDATRAGVEFRLKSLGNNCLGVTGGFSGDAGSFAGLSISTGDQLGLGETIEADAQYGVRLRRVQLGLTKPFFQAKRLEAGFTLYGQRFHYDQARDASILAFSRDISEFDSFGGDNLLKYVSHSYGGTASLQFALRKFSHVGLTYGYDVTGVTPLTPSTSGYFSDLDSWSARRANQLSGVRTGRVVLSYVHNTVDHPMEPTQGMRISTSVAIAGVGGDVNTVEPAIDLKWFHPGLRSRHVVGIHLHGRMLTGYGGKAAPPFDRYYMGGEDEIRGFASWAVSPIGYFPSAGTVPVLNADGSQRMSMTLVNGVVTLTPVTMTIPVYRPVTTGGDTKVVANVEYRIPLARPLTLAFFADAGVDRLSFGSQLRMDGAVMNNLNSAFPEAAFTNRVLVQPGSQKIRMSSGVELQVHVPKIRTPVRLYWAYNLLRYEDQCAVAGSDPAACNNVKQPFDRSMFPNNATFENASATFGTSTLVREPRSMLRVAIGFSF